MPFPALPKEFEGVWEIIIHRLELRREGSHGVREVGRGREERRVTYLEMRVGWIDGRFPLRGVVSDSYMFF